MALIGLVGGLILCGLLMAGLKNLKRANETTKVNGMKLQ